MKKILDWLGNNILYFCTLFLLFFIPLYPKLPLLDVRNTWVYIRVEDFLVFFVLAIWIFLFFKRKITLKTPLTIPIFLYWVVGIIATFHGILIIFPQAANVFPNVAFFSLIRHIEYASLFFVAFLGMRDKRMLPGVIAVISLTFFLVSLYGIGQKYLSFPAYLTMNEEFAKGIPITLSSLSRVPSTFAGHYDLAAYIVLIVPILVSLFMGARNWFFKFFFAFSALLGAVVLSMTVSRISFFALFIALLALLYMRSRRLFFIAIPLVILAGFIFTTTQSSLFARFGDTLKVVSVLVDSETGNPVGHVGYVSSEQYTDKILNQRKIGEGGLIYIDDVSDEMNPSASVSSTQLLKILPPQVPYISDVNLSTGENLPQGTSYINLSLSPVEDKLTYFFYEKKENDEEEPRIFVFHGNYLLKSATAYDLSFTTRFQGEWPHALAAFQKNILIGSGYGSVSLAVDNNYLRILGETGVLGFLSFFGIFIILGIYIKKSWKYISSNTAKSFIIGFSAGFIGLLVNALFIDVFEASKIAFVLWLLTGVVLATSLFYLDEKVDQLQELRKILSSPFAIIVYLLSFSSIIFSPMLGNFFTGDDFTWLRWATDCTNSGNCLSLETIRQYFFASDGFFYRPGTKVYFLLMHSIFWLNQVAYHMASIVFHVLVISLFFLISRKILKSFNLSVLASFLFATISGYVEIIHWTAATGHLINAFLILLSFYLFILWDENRKNIFLITSLLVSFLSSLFHELGVVIPILLISYKLIFGKEKILGNVKEKLIYSLLFIPQVFYLLMRLSGGSHWFSGDYSYNLIKLPLNVAGNSIGYIMLTLFGPVSLSFYQILRNVMRENVFVTVALGGFAIFIAYFASKLFMRSFTLFERRILLFGVSFFIISLIPFLGLGNITSRYSYLASIGVILILALLLRKAFHSFKTYGKEMSFLIMFMIISVFSLWHIIQIQQANSDWSGAGIKVQNFFVSVENLYENTWSTEPVEMHFVDVPIKYNDAWVFPVGLEDALWLAFRNREIKVFKHKTIDEAFVRGAGVSALYNPLFIFNDDGSLKLIKRPENYSAN